MTQEAAEEISGGVIVYASEEDKKIVISVLGTEMTIRLSAKKALALAQIILEATRLLSEQ